MRGYWGYWRESLARPVVWRVASYKRADSRGDPKGQSMDGVIRTVSGNIPATALGPCDYHDHLFQVSPLLTGDELDDEAASGREAAAMVAAGLGAMVEATPTALGRRPAALARVCAASGLKAVHVTGAHHEGHYGPGHWLLDESVDDLTRRFVADIVDGMPDTTIPDDDGPRRGPVACTRAGQPVRAGLVKAGIGYWRISHFEQCVLEAAARTALATGVAVMVHLDHGSAAFEVLGRLADAGVSPDRVALAHIDRNLDPGLHADLTQAGAYIGYDGMARHREAPDSALIDCLTRALEQGADPARILIGADVARRSRFVAYGGMPGLVYLPQRFLPRLRTAIGDELVTQMVTENPASLLSLRTH